MCACVHAYAHQQKESCTRSWKNCSRRSSACSGSGALSLALEVIERVVGFSSAYSESTRPIDARSKSRVSSPQSRQSC